MRVASANLTRSLCGIAIVLHNFGPSADKAVVAVGTVVVVVLDVVVVVVVVVVAVVVVVVVVVVV